jgi:D-galactarolactone isomerase
MSKPRRGASSGTNWPHPGENPKPDDALLFDLLLDWASDVEVRHRILVENPEALYGFPPIA